MGGESGGGGGGGGVGRFKGDGEKRVKKEIK